MINWRMGYEKKSSYTEKKKEVIKGFCLFVNVPKFHEKHITVITNSIKELSCEEARRLLIGELRIPGVRQVTHNKKIYRNFSTDTFKRMFKKSGKNSCRISSSL